MSKIGGAFKGAPHVVVPIFSRQTGLWCGIPYAGNGVLEEGDAKYSGNWSGNFQRLVETPRFHAGGVQGKRDNGVVAVPGAGNLLKHLPAQPGGQPKLMSIFECMNQLICRFGV